MGFSWNWTQVLLSQTVGQIIKLISPEFRQVTDALFQQWFESALQTDNPWDDYLVMFLAGIFGVKVTDPQPGPSD